MPYIVLDNNVATPIAAPAPNPAAPLTNYGITLASARAEIRAMLTGRQDIEDARLDFWLNRAYIDIATSARHDELKYTLGFTTVPDQPQYLLPNITVTTMTLSRVDPDSMFGGEPLQKIDITAYRTRKDMAAFQGMKRKPKEFFRQNRILVLYPTPDEAYEMVMDFRFEPLPLVVATDSPVLRTEWHESWLLLARKKVLGALAEWEANMAAGNELASHMRLRQDHEANEDENRIVASSVPRNDSMLRRKKIAPLPSIDH